MPRAVQAAQPSCAQHCRPSRLSCWAPQAARTTPRAWTPPRSSGPRLPTWSSPRTWCPSSTWPTSERGRGGGGHCRGLGPGGRPIAFSQAVVAMQRCWVVMHFSRGVQARTGVPELVGWTHHATTLRSQPGLAPHVLPDVRHRAWPCLLSAGALRPAAWRRTPTRRATLPSAASSLLWRRATPRRAGRPGRHC